MTGSDRERLRKLIDQRKRAQIRRAHGRGIVSDADRRMWQEADQQEERERVEARD